MMEKEGEMHSEPSIIEGVIGGAYKFSGKNAVKVCELKGINKSTELTFSAWLYFEEHTSSPVPVPAIIGIADNNSFGITTKGLYVKINDKVKEYSFNIKNREWTHVAFVIKEGKLIAYVNGNKRSVGDSFSMPAFDLYLGGNIQTNEYVECAIDEVCIYNDYLKEPQIKKLYNKDKYPGKMLFYSSCDILPKQK